MSKTWQNAGGIGFSPNRLELPDDIALLPTSYTDSRAPTSMQSGLIRVALADDSPMIRRSVSLTLRTQSDFVLAWQAADGAGAVALSRADPPDVIILDPDMPPLDGFNATRQIIADNPPVKIVVFCSHPHPESLAPMFSAGASAWVAKTHLFRLPDAIRTVHGGQHFICP